MPSRSKVFPSVLEFLLVGWIKLMLNNSPLKREGFDLAEAFLLGGCPRFAVTSTTKSFLTQPLYGEGRNPAPSEPPELTLSDPFSGFNDYDTGVKPGCYSGYNGLSDPFRVVGLNTIPSVAHDGVLKVAAKAETLPKPSAFFVSGNDRKGDDEGFRAHGRTLAQGCEMSVPCTEPLSTMDECRIPPSE